VKTAALLLALGALAEPKVKPGLDVLGEEGAPFLSGRPIGLPCLSSTA
jgi:hypothetical protein